MLLPVGVDTQRAPYLPTCVCVSHSHRRPSSFASGVSSQRHPPPVLLP